MCGIFGCVISKSASIESREVERILRKLALYSESRGKDSSGLAVLNSNERKIQVLKGNIRIKSLLDSSKAKELIKKSLNPKNFNEFNYLSFGHARLVTDGSQLIDYNNQPVIKDNLVTIHNGIIVNADRLWTKNQDLNRDYQIDTEIINSLLNKNLKSEENIFQSVDKALNQLEGSYSIASYIGEMNALLLATNTGSLYFKSDFESYLFFASEEFYLKELDKNDFFRKSKGSSQINRLGPNEKLFINLTDFQIQYLAIDTNVNEFNNFTIVEEHITGLNDKKELIIDSKKYRSDTYGIEEFDKYQLNLDAIRDMKRCSKCILPETFPFIHFDNDGVCNYCKNYKKRNFSKDLDNLYNLVDPYRRPHGQIDCIVPYSGGRDSTYALHLIKNELKLNPITLTYDWGMVTDLARRNIARVTGKLGVENIVVSANIRWKRDNIRKNIEAWLKNPNLGMIPLFMAGDKYFFYYTKQLKKKTGINLNIWGINNLENTDFKIGFAGIKPDFDKENLYSISTLNKLKLFGYISENMISNPKYLNQSVFDTLGSFVVRYFSNKEDYYHLFDYYQWNELEINDILQNTYGWEKADDTKSTWRIGDGTASFYNFIYYTVAGFTEHDTFRSNQIRENLINREDALKSVMHENIPRYESLRWFTDIIGLDFVSTVKRINEIPKLYDHRMNLIFPTNFK
jgi:glucosamine--fructose-6-phosphate aminotransferase (isomerizing)